MNLPFDPVELLQRNGVTFIDLLRDRDLSTQVSSCPGWDLGDLAYHQGEVWHFWTRIVSEGLTERSALKQIETPPRPDGPLLIDWLATTHNGIFSALVDTPPDRPVWTWTGRNRDVMWVRRRMAQETAIHLWDVAKTVGYPYEIPTSVAADGIDEFLTYFAGRERREGEMKVGGTVHLHCTDTSPEDVAGGEWYVSSLKEPTATFTREHRKGDAAVRGTAANLLLWLWRRDTHNDGSVEVIGDEVVARRFRAYTDLD